jgi:hypothetical protein
LKAEFRLTAGRTYATSGITPHCKGRRSLSQAIKSLRSSTGDDSTQRGTQKHCNDRRKCWVSLAYGGRAATVLRSDHAPLTGAISRHPTTPQRAIRPRSEMRQECGPAPGRNLHILERRPVWALQAAQAAQVLRNHRRHRKSCGPRVPNRTMVATFEHRSALLVSELTGLPRRSNENRW